MSIAGLVLVIACACGVRIKVPPEYDGDDLPCTRCGRRHQVPRAEIDEALVATAAVVTATTAAGDGGPATSPDSRPEAPLVFRRRGEGWQAFRCTCGKTLQVSPALSVSAIRCKKCRRRIEIRDASG